MSEELLTLRLPASIGSAAARLASESGVPLDEWIVATVTQRVETTEFFRQRTQAAKTGDLAAILARVPDRDPDPGDELPDDWKPSAA